MILNNIEFLLNPIDNSYQVQIVLIVFLSLYNIINSLRVGKVVNNVIVQRLDSFQN
jgi:hypothetical protein